MSLKTKLNFFSLLVIALIPFGILWYSRTHRPPPPPPPEPRKEVTITIIPGWNLRDVADDWVKKGIVKTPEELFAYTGTPATDYRTHASAEPVRRIVTSTDFDILFSSKPNTISYEGYLFPETYRVYADAKPDEVLKKIFGVFRDRVPAAWSEELKRQNKSFFDMLTMASILEDEAITIDDKKIVADILWRRLKRGMRLQVDSSVHYVSARTGDVFTTKQEREADSPWNTYKYQGMPLGPIGNPSLTSIEAALYPITNSYWYFLAGRDGKMQYAKTYEEHMRNVVKYLR
jgi:UPF0755 protein